MNKLADLGSICLSIAKNPTIKLVGASIMSVIAYFVDINLWSATLSLLLLVIADLLIALVAVRRDPKEKIESRKLARTAGKIGIYFLLIASGKHAENAIANTIGVIDEAVIATLAVTELLSIFENASRMGYAIPKKILDWLHGYLEK